MKKMRSYINLQILFKSIEHKSKRLYYSNKILQCKDSAKKARDVMKELIGKSRNAESSLPKKFVIEKKK